MSSDDDTSAALYAHCEHCAERCDEGHEEPCLTFPFTVCPGQKRLAALPVPADPTRICAYCGGRRYSCTCPPSVGVRESASPLVGPAE